MVAKGVASIGVKLGTKVFGKAIANAKKYGSELVVKGDKAAKKIRKRGKKGSETCLIDGLKGVVHEGAPMLDPMIFAELDSSQLCL